jgi:hypothetical protein
MSHRAWIGLFFILTSVAVIGAAGAQPPAADEAPVAQSGQPQPQAKQAPAAESASPTDEPSKPSPPPSPPPTSGTNSLPTIQVNAGPSADILRSARNAGFKIKIADGKWHFCKTEAPIGSRFTSESCMSEEQVTLFLSRAQDQREKLGHMVGAPAAAR